MATKLVLLLGALVVAALLLLQLLPLEYLYARPGAPPLESPFSGLGPGVGLWIALLAIALVRDYVVSRRDRNVVRPFATVLNPGSFPEDDRVTQVSDGPVLSTSTSGSLSDRTATVTFRDNAGTRTGHVLRVDVSCNCPWALEIRRNSLVARLLGRAGAVVATGDRELDAIVVVQADDDIAVRHWLREPAVRSRVISLFQQHQVDSVSLRDGGSVLRAELLMRPFAQPRPDATAITEALSVLAETLEQR